MLKGELPDPGNTYNRQPLANEVHKALNSLEQSYVDNTTGSIYAQAVRDYLYTVAYKANLYVPAASRWNVTPPAPAYAVVSTPVTPPFTFPPAWGNV